MEHPIHQNPLTPASFLGTLNSEPRTLNLSSQAIPEQLKLAPRWLLWRYRSGRDGPLGKIPFRPCGRRANPADSRSWHTFQTVAATFERHLRTQAPYDGIAFALGEGFAAVELSAVFDKSDHLLPWAAKLIDELATYTELSPDSDGVNLFVSGTFEGRNIEPVPHPAGGSIALWRHDRFLCLTGDSWPAPTPLPLADSTQKLNHLAHRLRSGPVGPERRGVSPTCSQDVAPHQPSRSTDSRALTIEEQEPAPRKLLGPHETPNTKHQTRSVRQQVRASIPNDFAQEHAEQPETERIADQIVDLALTDFRLGRTPTDETFAVPRVGPNMAYMLRGGSTPLRKALARQFRSRHGRTLSANALNDAVNAIDAEAADLEPEQVALRVAYLPAAASQHETRNTKHETQAPQSTNEHREESETEIAPADGIVIDLGRSDGRVVQVTSDGWRILDRSPVLFRRTSLNAPLPLPAPGGKLEELRSFVNVTDEGYQMLRGWLVAALFPSIAHPILVLRGVQGTGKTTALSMLAGLVDPSSALTLGEPADSDNWVLMANNVWCLALDNVVGFSAKFSESLCKAVTGHGSVRRLLYTDGDYAVIAFRRVLALTCIKLGPIAEDLAARMLPVGLELIEKTARLSETGLLARFNARKPQLFGALLDELAATLRNLPSVHLEELPRMADFARILAALPCATGGAAASQTSGAAKPIDTAIVIEEQKQALRSVQAVATGGLRELPPSLRLPVPPSFSAGTPLSIYLRNIDQLMAEIAESDPVAEAVSEFMSTRSTWQGTATELLALLPKPEESRGWPKTGQYLTVRLNEIASALQTMRITVTHTRSNDLSRKRLVELKTIPEK